MIKSSNIRQALKPKNRLRCDLCETTVLKITYIHSVKCFVVCNKRKIDFKTYSLCAKLCLGLRNGNFCIHNILRWKFYLSWLGRRLSKFRIWIHHLCDGNVVFILNFIIIDRNCSTMNEFSLDHRWFICIWHHQFPCHSINSNGLPTSFILITIQMVWYSGHVVHHKINCYLSLILFDDNNKAEKTTTTTI